MGDIIGGLIVGLDRMLVANKAGFEADLAAKAPGTEIKLIVRRGASEKSLTVALAAEPKPVRGAKAMPILQLDPGGHMALIRDLAFTPDGKFIVSAGDDKIIRVWDWRKSATVRTIRGRSGLGDDGKALFTQALVEALNGEADFSHPGHVDTVELNDYLQKRVPELAKRFQHEQNPQFFKGRDAETYALAVAQ